LFKAAGTTYSAEGVTRLSFGGDVLLLVVQVGIIDATRAGHKEINVAWDLNECTISSCGEIVAEFRDVAEKDSCSRDDDFSFDEHCSA
jgi:hypothetical protein